MGTKKPVQKGLPSGIVTVMFTDIVNSTKLKGLMEGETSARRDAKFREQIKEPHDKLVLSSVEAAGGHKINSLGDGFCFAFSDSEEAVLCALDIQEGLSSVVIQTPLGALQIRIGIHTGRADPSEGDYSASTVDKAARVQAKTEGGHIFLSREAHALVVGKLQGVAFKTAGVFELKGLEKEELYRAVKASGPCDAQAADQSAVGTPPELAPLPNPYNFSNSATDKTFKGRQDELDELVDSIESGTHTAIFGLQRMGKTSLIEEGLRERLARQPELSRTILLAKVDLMKLGGDEVTYKDLLHALLQAITEQLSAIGIGKKLEELRGFTNELWAGNRYDRGDRTVFFSRVGKLLRGIAELARRRIVLFIDEFSEVRRVIERNKKALVRNPLRTKNILPHEMYIDIPFIHHLGSLLKDQDLHEKLTLLVAVRPFMAEYDAKEGLQILKLMKPVTLYYLDDAAAKALITEPLKGHVSYEEGVVDYLTSVTAGHPYLLQFLLKNLIDKVRRSRRRVVTLDDIAKIEEKMTSEGPAYDAQFEVVLSDYSVAEVMHPQEALLGKGTLALVAKLGQEQHEGWVHEAQVFDALLEHKIPQEKAASLLSQLVRTKILEEDSSSGAMRYRMSIPLVQKRFVKQNLYLKYFR